MAWQHFTTAAGPLGFFLYDEGKNRPTYFKEGSIFYILYTSFSLSSPFFNGKTIKSVHDYYHKAFPFSKQKLLINSMRTISPNEICAALSISLDRTSCPSSLCPRSGICLHTGSFVAAVHSHD